MDHRTYWIERTVLRGTEFSIGRPPPGGGGEKRTAPSSGACLPAAALLFPPSPFNQKPIKCIMQAKAGAGREGGNWRSDKSRRGI